MHPHSRYTKIHFKLTKIPDSLWDLFFCIELLEKLW